MRKRKIKLEVELIPASMWGRNIRKIISKTNWDTLRWGFKATNKKPQVIKINLPDRDPIRDDISCYFCVVKKEYLDLHEQWQYDDKKLIQHLTGLIPICKDCHLSIHIGRANKVGFGEKARKHLAKVNGWTVKETEEHITKAGGEWLHRSGNEYKLDLKWLEQYVPSSEIHLDKLEKVGERESLKNITQEDALKIEKADLKKAKDDMRKENAALKKWEVALKKEEADMKSRKKHIMKRQGIEEPEDILYPLGSVVRKKSRSEYDKACECEKCKIEYYYDEFGESHTAYRITRCNECVKEYGEEYEISNMWTNLDCLLEEKERIRISFFYKKKENGRKENGKTEALIYR